MSDHEADFLFARPSIAEGVARLMDFRAVLSEFNSSLTEEHADLIATSMDWQAVRTDLMRAYQELAEQIERERGRQLSLAL